MDMNDFSKRAAQYDKFVSFSAAEGPFVRTSNDNGFRCSQTSYTLSPREVTNVQIIWCQIISYKSYNTEIYVCIYRLLHAVMWRVPCANKRNGFLEVEFCAML
jgi:hypothetical protein